MVEVLCALISVVCVESLLFLGDTYYFFALLKALASAPAMAEFFGALAFMGADFECLLCGCFF